MVTPNGAGAAPRVSVIIATYNQSTSLRCALTSVLQQEFADFEIMVVGDACTDDSGEVVASFGDDRLRWLNLERNSGSQSRPNNAGLQAARGRYIAYLGHDDLWFPSHLQGLVTLLDTTGAALAHALLARIGPRGALSCATPPPPGVTYANYHVPPSCWLHRRDLIQTCGLWHDPNRLAWTIDFDYLRRVHLGGHTIVCHPELTVLKFPSTLFQPYARIGVAPQEPYMAMIRDAPEECRYRVLLELARAPSRQWFESDNPGIRQATGDLLRALLRRAVRDHRCLDVLEIPVRLLAECIGYVWPSDYVERAGHDSPLLARYIRHKFQQERRATRVHRGLPAGPK